MQFRKRQPSGAEAGAEAKPLPAAGAGAKPLAAQAGASPKPLPTQRAKPSMPDILLTALAMLIMVDGESFLFGKPLE
jgi:hypothetical protein